MSGKRGGGERRGSGCEGAGKLGGDGKAMNALIRSESQTLIEIQFEQVT